mmetsp:Transcript_24325/g.29851  ORF Transcript_24325/g.29851 Transcript_24325/m.29851 type:complete len:134 (-) Transcript_24325:483-884(-)|eukprot:CAMPEP_0194358302 /NCGR_PEP_ID=MMETSP0174-20130528/5550_1 /TAXON_ID=216777 /ORGANISM="Proboscia alata, Strain PI-D3" /LENGTH=133 /DNA_ID=CAMNT_0039128571 /DNA_START=28 /DNA_END=429 /DNA_ORIENTATION=+
MKSNSIIYLLVAYCVTNAFAFNALFHPKPKNVSSRHSFQKKSFFSGIVSPNKDVIRLHMADDNDKKSGDLYDDGLYDDEIAPKEDTLSNSMRDRLMKEANSGLDPNAKSTNVLLYIGLAVAVLVALGGSGILF